MNLAEYKLLKHVPQHGWSTSVCSEYGIIARWLMMKILTNIFWIDSTFNKSWEKEPMELFGKSTSGQILEKLWHWRKSLEYLSSLFFTRYAFLLLFSSYFRLSKMRLMLNVHFEKLHSSKNSRDILILWLSLMSSELTEIETSICYLNT